MGPARHRREHQQPRPQPIPTPQVHTLEKDRSARRCITPQAGHALEILGHAIEYLADEYAHSSGSIPAISAADPQIEAIQVLMRANRQVYYACPLVPPRHKMQLFRKLAKLIQNAIQRSRWMFV